jgi:hypothetical protein
MCACSLVRTLTTSIVVAESLPKFDDRTSSFHLSDYGFRYFRVRRIKYPQVYELGYYQDQELTKAGGLAVVPIDLPLTSIAAVSHGRKFVRET